LNALSPILVLEENLGRNGINSSLHV
jgi:hypothetical protein